MLKPSIKHHPKLFRKLTIGAISIILLLSLSYFYLARLWQNFAKEYNLHIGSFQFEYPAHLILHNFQMEKPGDVQANFEHLQLSWHWKPLLKGQLIIDQLSVNQGAVAIFGGSSDTDFDIPITGLTLQNASLNEFDFTWMDTSDSLHINVPSLRLNAAEVKDTIVIDSLIVQEGAVNYAYALNITDSAENTPPATLASFPDFSINAIDIMDSQIQLKNQEQTHTFSGIYLALNGWKNTDLLNFQMEKLAFTYQDTLALDLELKDGQITNNLDTRLQNISLAFPGLALNIDEIYLSTEDGFEGSLALGASSLSFGALKWLYPDILIVMNPEIPDDSLIAFGGNLRFNEEHLLFDSLALHLLQATKSNMTGIIDWSGDTTTFNLQFNQLHTQRADLYTFLLEQDYDEFYLWPSNAYGHAVLRGNSNYYDIQGSLATHEGSFDIQSVIYYDLSDNLFYDLEIESDSVLISELIDYLPLDVPHGHAKIWMGGLLANDEALDTFRMNITSKKFEVEKHIQENLKFSYFFNNQYDSIWGTLANDSINAAFRGAYYAADTSWVSFEGTVYELDPQLLTASLPLENFQSDYNGRYEYYGDDYYQIILETDTALITSATDATVAIPPTRLVYQEDSGLLMADLFANAQPVFHVQTGAELPSFSTGNRAWLYEMADTEASLKLQIDSTTFEQLTGFSGAVTIEQINLRKANDFWNVDAQVPYLRYENYEMHDISMQANIDSLSQEGLLHIAGLNNPYLPLDSLFIDISHDQEKYLLNVNTLLSEIDEKVTFGIDLFASADQYIIRLDEQKAFQLGNEDWQVNENQGLAFDANFALQSGAFALQNENTQLRLETLKDGNLQLGIIDLDLSRLMSAVDTTLLAEGYLNANLHYNPRTSAVTWKGEIRQISLEGLQIGDLRSDGSSVGDTLMANLELIHDNTHALVHVDTKDGTYHYTTSLKNFDLGMLQSHPAWPEAVSLSGKIQGEVSGTFDSTLYAEGFLVIDQTTLKPTEISTVLQIENDTIFLNNDELIFKGFTIHDAVLNPLTFNGSVKLFPEIFTFMHIKSDNFQAINDKNPKVQTKGNLEIATDIDILGPPDELAVSGSLKIQPGTFVTYTYQGSTNLIDASQTVSFVDFTKLDEAPAVQNKPSTNSIIWNIDLDIANADIQIILNEVSQEFIRVALGGQVRLREGSDNIPLVYGNVTASNGRALIFPPVVPNLNLNVEETTLQWNGEAENPEITFRGVETLRASPKGLPTLNDRTELVTFKLLVLLDHVTPDNIALKFDLESVDTEVNNVLQGLPPETREGYAIQLLVLGYIGEKSNGGNTALLESTASKLNEIANRNLKKTDVSFGVEEQEINPGVDDGKTQTNLNYKISRGLFNNKIFISVGGDVGLYTTGEAVNTPTSHLIGNVELSYILSESPSIALVGARKHVYEGVIDGDVVRTSLGLNFRKVYPNLYSIFHKTEK